ncbi:hypothetical protein PMAYCL1PPCAC_16699 [Pristionchus mayeri]|uniref:Uncharacterized protein n=1 Tax=Pristionchus mayeri TaxID=1317129 RepID=A0AAN5CLA2_9BILA|nr:hypothetical protein PMAYCL1PPCAC_16699 [Pristionchus mayeri]
MSFIGYPSFDPMFNDYHALCPYWDRVPTEYPVKHEWCELGEVENTNDLFAINKHASHFKPDESRVDRSGNEITTDGNRNENSEEHGTINRGHESRDTQGIDLGQGLPEDRSPNENGNLPPVQNYPDYQGMSHSSDLLSHRKLYSNLASSIVRHQRR